MKVSKSQLKTVLFAVVLGVALVAPVSVGSATVSIAPSFDKAFEPSTIGPGSTTTLTFTINNSDNPGYPAADLAFSDTLPAGVNIADPAGATNGCGGILSAPDGGSTISLTGGNVGGGATCTITVNVTSSTIATDPGHQNVSGDLTSSLGNSGTASADLAVDDSLPGFSKSFSPDTITLGGTSTLTFLIDNTGNSSDVVELAFSDTLPVGMVVASPASASTDCGDPLIPATVTAASGSSNIELDANGIASFPALEAGETCTVEVDVTTTVNGTFDNVSDSLIVGLEEAGFATASLSVPLNTLNKLFVGDPATPGSTIILQFTIQNPSRTDALTGISFTDDLDAALTGLSATPPPDPDPPCGAGSSLTGSTLLTFTGGSLDPEESCTFTVEVTIPGGATPGTYTNTTSAVTGTLGGDAFVGIPASDVLTVTDAPTLTKEFTDDPVGAGGTTTLHFEITDNTASSGSTGIAFDDPLTYLPEPPGLSVTLPADGFCGGGSKIVVFDDGLQHGLRMTGGSLGAGASCAFDVLIDIPDGFPGGDYLNTTGEISATVGGSPAFGTPASDTLTVYGAPEFTKEFAADAVAPGGTVSLEFTISQPDTAAGPATGIGFADVLPGFTASPPPDPDPPCGAGSTLTGTTTLFLSGGSLDPGEECTFTVDVTESGSTFGTRTNTTDNLAATVLGEAVTGLEAEDDIVVTPVTFTKEFTDDPALAGDTVTLEFTITNTSATLDATEILFTDDLEADLTGLAASGGPTPSPPCGAGSSLSGTTFLIFTGGSVPASSSCTFTVPVDVPAGAADDLYRNGTSALFLKLDGTSFSQSPAIDFLEIVSPLPPLVTKEFTDDPALAGDTVTLEFTVTNPNTGDAMTAIAFDDVLTDALAGLSASPPPTPDPPCGLGSTLTGTTTLSLTGGTLPAGDSCTFSVDVEIPGGADPGSYLNETTDPTATVGGLGVTGEAATDVLDVVTSTPEADLSIDKTDDPDPAVKGGSLTYTITVTNNGPEAASAVEVTDTLPAGVTFVSTSGCQNDPAGVPTCTLTNSLSAGSSQAFTVTVNVNAMGGTLLSNTATVSSTTADPDLDNNTVEEETEVAALCNGLVGTIYGTSAGETIVGTAGPDVIIAFGGNDRIYGLAGDDTISAGSGDDEIIGGADDDTIFGQSGNDTVEYGGAPSAVTVDLGNGFATGGDGTDTISSVANVIGSTHDDTIFGNALANILDGGNGNDTIDARSGHDVLLGGSGDDVLRGRAGDDDMKGGSGTDTASYAFAVVGVTVDLRIVGPQATGMGADTLRNIENVLGSAFADSITGNAQANTLTGASGNDVLFGKAGNDFLIGNSGFDNGVGGPGFDTCLTENQNTCEAP